MCDNALPVWRGEGTIQDEIGGGEGQSAPRGRSMKKKSTQSRGGVKGGFPLAGSRGGAPCGVWGNAPTVPRATSMPNALNKGAGSEASLPVTLRIRRCAPKLLYPSTQHCRARWARPTFRPKRQTPEHSIHSCIPALFVKQTYSITIQTYVVPSAIVYSRMLLAG